MNTLHFKMEQQGVHFFSDAIRTFFRAVLHGKHATLFPPLAKARFSFPGQLGLTLFNPLGHLESPHCTAHWDYPRMKGPRTSFMSLLQSFSWSLARLLRRLLAWKLMPWLLQSRLVAPIVLGMGAGFSLFLFTLTLKGSCHPPLRSVGRGGLSGERATSCHHEMIYWAETQSPLL